MTISRVENACKPLILLGLQKNIKIISTQYLTVLMMGAILQLEQRKRNRKDQKEKEKRYCGVLNPELYQLATLETTSRVLMAAVRAAHKNLFLMF